MLVGNEMIKPTIMSYSMHTTGIIVNFGFTLNNYYKSITQHPSLKFSLIFNTTFLKVLLSDTVTAFTFGRTGAISTSGMTNRCNIALMLISTSEEVSYNSTDAVFPSLQTQERKCSMHYTNKIHFSLITEAELYMHFDWLLLMIYRRTDTQTTSPLTICNIALQKCTL